MGKKVRRVHRVVSESADETVCSLPVTEAVLTTTEAAKVTCGNCAKSMQPRRQSEPENAKPTASVVVL